MSTVIAARHDVPTIEAALLSVVKRIACPPGGLAQAKVTPSSVKQSNMEHALQLPRLNLNAFPTQPQFLEPISPPTFPFPAPKWCMEDRPRAVSLLDVYKNNELLMTYRVDMKSFYLIGRNSAVCDIVLEHCSISRLHATIIHHQEGPTYIVDLRSGHGTFVDGIQLKPLQPTLIANGAIIKFGASSRSYTFKSFQSRDQIIETVQSRMGLDPEEQELQRNTMLNFQVAHRLELSPRFRDEPLYPMFGRGTSGNGEPIQEYSTMNDRKSTADESCLLFAAALRKEEPARKRSRGQSSNSTASSDLSDNTYAVLSGLDAAAIAEMLEDNDEDDEELETAQEVPKRVQFWSQPPTIIPTPIICDDDEEEGQTDEAHVSPSRE